jgi:hypothetical protein
LDCGGRASSATAFVQPGAVHVAPRDSLFGDMGSARGCAKAVADEARPPQSKRFA